MYRYYQESIVPPTPISRYANLFYVHFQPSDKSPNDVSVAFHVQSCPVPIMSITTARHAQVDSIHKFQIKVLV